MRAVAIALAVLFAASAATAQSASPSTSTQGLSQDSAPAADSLGAYSAMLYQQMLLAYWLTTYAGSADGASTSTPYGSDAWFTDGAALTAMPSTYFTGGTALTNVPSATVMNGAMTQGASTNDATALTVSDRVPSTTPDGHRVSIYSVAGGRAAMDPAPTAQPSSPAPDTQ